MEPITHFLTGACIGRAGLNRKTAYATLAAVLAAEAADIDVLWAFAGPVEELKHHRGITHTFLGAPVVAARWSAWSGSGIAGENGGARGGRCTQPRTRSASGHRAAGPLGLALSHRAHRRAEPPAARLDQQLRRAALLPVQSALVCGQLRVHRRAGAVGAASCWPWSCPGCSDWPTARSERAASRFRGRGWAIFALAGMVVLWCWRWAEQAQARAMLENTQVTTAPVDAHGARALSGQPVPLARHSRDRRLLPDRAR